MKGRELARYVSEYLDDIENHQLEIDDNRKYEFQRWYKSLSLEQIQDFRDELKLISRENIKKISKSEKDEMIKIHFPTPPISDDDFYKILLDPDNSNEKTILHDK
jgi:hypothetical protein